MKNPRNSSDSSSDDIMNDLKPVSKGIAQQEKVRESVALDKKVSDREAYMKSTIDEIEEECRREEKNKRDQEVSGTCAAFYIAMVQFLEISGVKINAEYKDSDIKKLVQYYNKRIKIVKDNKSAAFEAAQKLLYKRTKIAFSKKFMDEL